MRTSGACFARRSVAPTTTHDTLRGSAHQNLINQGESMKLVRYGRPGKEKNPA
ncbi:hypothetical protein ACFS07_24685 [Undibacterium arcticum]